MEQMAHFLNQQNTKTLIKKIMIQEKIKSRLDKLGKSQRWLSKQTGIRAASFSLFFRGMQEFQSANLDKICKVLNLELKEVQDENK